MNRRDLESGWLPVRRSRTARKSIQPAVGDHEREAGYSQHEQQHQYEDRESDLDQRKTPGSLHRGKLLVSLQITTAPARGIFGVPGRMSQPRGQVENQFTPSQGRNR